jgi:hypothetical protein
MLIPSVSDYAEMSWHARQHVAKRIRRQMNDKARRERHKRDAVIWSEALRMEADYWYESIPVDEPELITERRALLETEYRR